MSPARIRVYDSGRVASTKIDEEVLLIEDPFQVSLQTQIKMLRIGFQSKTKGGVAARGGFSEPKGAEFLII